MQSDLSADEAIEQMERCAFDTGERQIIHCFRGTIGADWDAAAAIDLVKASKWRGWYDSLWGRCLAVVDATGVYVFDTVRPQEVLDEAQ